MRKSPYSLRFERLKDVQAGRRAVSGKKFGIHLLGGLSVTLTAGEPCPIVHSKARALLALLAASPGQRHSRDKLAALLWPDSDDRAGRDNLRQALARLRRHLGPWAGDAIMAEANDLALSPAHVSVDVERFVDLCESGHPADLTAAMSLYRGEFLDGFVLREAPFEVWQQAERRRLHDLAVAASRRLLRSYLDDDSFVSATDGALTLLRLDAYDEFAHRSLMRIYLRQGRTGASLQQYAQCRETLRRGLDVAPERETTELYRQILQHRARPVPDNDSRVDGRTAEGGAAGSIVTADAAATTPARNGKRTDYPPSSQPDATPPVGRIWQGWQRRLAAAAIVPAVVLLPAAFLLLTGNTGAPPAVEPVPTATTVASPVDAKVRQATALMADRNWLDRSGIDRARAMLTPVVAEAPNHADALAALAFTYWLEARARWGGGPYERQQARTLAQSAVALGRAPLAHQLLANLELFPLEERDRNYDRAIAIARTAVQLDPASADALADLAQALLYAGQPQEALVYMTRARGMVADPPDWYLYVSGFSHLLTGDADKAVDDFRLLYDGHAGVLVKQVPLALAASLVYANRTAEASAVLGTLRDRYPNMTLQAVRSFYRVFRRDNDIQVILQGIASAGLPPADETL